MKRANTILLSFLTLFSVTLSSCFNDEPSSSSSSNSSSEVVTETVLVRFFNIDGNLLVEKYVDKGSDVSMYAPRIPDYTDNTYRHYFIGWDKDFKNIIEDTDFHPLYRDEYIDYLVEFLNDDGKLLYRGIYHYDDVVEYAYTIPEKQSDNDYSYYKFVGWSILINNSYYTEPKIYTSEDPLICKEDTLLKANYELVRTHYQAKFVNYDQSVLYEHYFKVDELVSYQGEEPTREGEEGTYTFTGWNPAIPNTPLTKDTVFTAQYSLTKYVFTVSFYDDDKETLLDTKEIEYGNAYNSKGTITPTKESGSIEYYYKFAGWDYGSNFIVKSNISVYAMYQKIEVKYNVSFKSNGGLWKDNHGAPIIKSKDFENIYNGRSIITPNKPEVYYEGVSMDFLGWSKSNVYKEGVELINEGVNLTVSEDATYYALWRKGTAPNYGVDYTEFGHDNDGYYYSAKKSDNATYSEYAIKGIVSSNIRGEGNKIYVGYTTKIESRAWEDDRNITSIYMDDCSRLTVIEDRVFYRCYELEKVILPESLTTINQDAFLGCTKIKNFVIPASVNFIYNMDSSIFLYFKHTSYLDLPQTRVLPYNSVIKDTELYSEHNDYKGKFAIYSENEPIDNTYKYWRYVNEVPTLWP